MYGCEILYNGREQNDFEKILLSYLKNMLGVRKQTPTLEIERGRHTILKTAVASRICRRCQTNQVDDEICFF